MTIIEAIATAFGLLCVWFTIKQDIRCWPTGLVQVILYIAVFYHARLYSDMILHVIYVILQIYGWHRWLHGGDRDGALPVTRSRPREIILWSAGTALAAVVWGTLMFRLTDAAAPHADAAIAAMSLLAQWLLARKRLESWYYWILVDILAIGVYYHRGLYITMGLYAVFLVMAASGLVAWRRTCVTPALSADEA